MGQQISTECQCQDGFFHLCAPEDPNTESNNTVLGYQPNLAPGYPAPMLSERDVLAGSTNNVAMSLMKQGGGFDLTSEERAWMSAPPPPEDHDMTGLPPPSPSGGSPPPVSPNRNSSSPSQRDVTADDILSNLEGSEEVLYGDAFASFPGGRNGVVGLDSTAMRDFICTNSAISMQDVDMELLKVASPEEGLYRDAFLHLLRDFPVSESDAISQFLGLSADGERLASEECRSGLLLFSQQMLSSNFSEDRWECILNTVMWDAGMMVPMDQWISYCKLIGRTVRLLRYAQVQKLALGSRNARPGIRGGA